MIKRYVKSPPISIEESKARQKQKKKLRILAKSLILLGVLIIISVAWPLASYELFLAPNLKQQEYLNPLAHMQEEQFLSKNYQSAKVTENKKLTNPKNWFPKADFTSGRQSKITHYTLSIPRFDINEAVVEIGGEDLSKSLIHFPNTALPGEPGATIIFGHSILPQFFNPKNYQSIFSLIPTLELGDEVYIKFDGIKFTYKVIDKVEVKPTNIAVLDQPYDNEYLRLITCTPPGTYLRRGVITAALVD